MQESYAILVWYELSTEKLLCTCLDEKNFKYEFSTS